MITEAQATVKGLTEIWKSSGSKRQNLLAQDIVNDLQSKGVDAEVVDSSTRIGTIYSVWRDKAYVKRLRKELF